MLWLSFTDYSVTRDVPASFIGFDNYKDVLTAPVVHKRAVTTLIFVLGAVGLQTILGFTIAFLISRRIKGRGALTTLFLIPMMLSPIVVGLFWKFMLDVQFGVVNSFLEQPRARPVEWLTNQRLALLLAGHRRHLAMDAVHHADRARGPDGGAQYLYEAAEIDRASEWFKFRRITFPLVWPLLLIAVMFRAIEAFRLFDLVYILTGGGPGGTTETLSYQVYKVAFFGFDTGRASAYGLLIVIVVTLAAQFYLRYLNNLQER